MLKRLALFLVVLVAHIGVAWSASDIHFGNYHALVTGNNDYSDLPKLKTAVNDAKAVATLLETDYGFNVQLLIDATRNEVIRALANLRGDLGPNDNLLIYYAGHGVLDEYAEEGYWLPVDAEKDSPGNWVSNSDLTNMLRAIRAKHVMVVADSCYSGTLVRAATVTIRSGAEREAWLKRMINKRSRTALVSVGLEPVIDSGGGGEHSVFAKAFLDALTANRDVLDGQAMFAAVKRPVALESDQTPQYSDIRRSGHDGGDFLLVRRNVTTRGIAVAPRSDQGTEPAATPQSSPPAASQAAEIAFWNSIKESKDPGEYQAYLSQFPSGVFAPLAKQRLKSLTPEQQTAAVVVPPKPATPSPVQPAVGVFPDLKPGDTFKDCDECPEMVVIPAGTFMMGSSEAERRWADNQGGLTEIEVPLHRVTIGNDFVMGKFEVTLEEFAAFVSETGHDATGSCSVWVGSEWNEDSQHSWRDPGFAQSERDPVACVNWQDATAYVKWLSRKTGHLHLYRLPSESEWEYAARAGTETMRYWGDDRSNSKACGYANTRDATGKRANGLKWEAVSCDGGRAQIAPVGSYRANGFGLHDVLGNVSEWVEDCWEISYAGAPSDGSAWTSGDCEFRIQRGGSWFNGPWDLRSAVRGGNPPHYRFSSFGFRVARTLTPATDPKTVALITPSRPETSSPVKPAVGVFPGLTPGTVFRDCDECPEMVVIPAGEFMMGAPESEEGAYLSERPVHLVSLSSFAMGKFEVTFEEWEACVGDGGCNDFRPDDNGWGRGQRPVIEVSWEDAHSYVSWLSRKTGHTYRLPSESEWEYAGRARTATRRYWGSDLSDTEACANANVNDVTSKRVNNYEWGVMSCDDGHARTAPVGTYRANSFGLYDVLGNVWEWVADCWNDSYSGAPSDGSAWTSGNCDRRAQRGGAWHNLPSKIRSAVRTWRESDARRYNVVGFRIARTLTP